MTRIMSNEIKIGDVIAWKDVPDGALVRDDQARCVMRRPRRGIYVLTSCGWLRTDGQWLWGHGRPTPVTVVALGLTGDESADDLRRLAEVFEVREVLWEDACDQTWCVCVGQRVGQRVVVLHGWTEETKDLDDEQGLTMAAERLHAAGWRPGMTAEDAARLLGGRT